MSTEIRVPQLGESLTEATVGHWLKHEGESVVEGETVVELETEKVNMEVPATISGVLQSIVKQEGEAVAVDDVLAVVAEGASPPAGGNENRESDGGSEPAGAVKIEAAPASSQAASAPAGVFAQAADADGPRATPLARRVAAERGVDIAAVKGTGPSGRVTRDDVTAFVEGRPATPSQPPATSGNGSSAAIPTTPAAAELAEQRREERVRMSRRRQTIARRLVEAQHSAAMLTTFNEVDMSAIMELRRRRRDAFKERHGVGLGFMSFFTKAVIGALKAFPRLNAEIQGDEMILKHYYDIGIAVGVEEGLVVPVVRDADHLSFAQIERQIGELAEKARTNALTLANLQGGTFTITNGGIFGSLLSTPILNAPQVGILGMHKIEERPIAVSGQVVVRPMMYLALSYDHRIVDGGEAVRFLVRVKELLEDPETLLLEG
ncbi:MAG: 2-oxoglutarate dehydrogenase complex dihydrolipoyllysine-residue succinyltransferase [Chloroflexota bacterium]